MSKMPIYDTYYIRLARATPDRLTARLFYYVFAMWAQNVAYAIALHLLMKPEIAFFGTRALSEAAIIR